LNCIFLLCFYKTNTKKSQDYLNLPTTSNKCFDIAYEFDCKQKAQQGLCQAQLADAKLVHFYCQKTCGICKSSTWCLTCNNLVRNCISGSCYSTTYFGQSSIKCSCPFGKVGTYCQKSKNPGYFERFFFSK
jgi:hypothetical protein